LQFRSLSDGSARHSVFYFQFFFTSQRSFAKWIGGYGCCNGKQTAKQSTQQTDKSSMRNHQSNNNRMSKIVGTAALMLAGFMGCIASEVAQSDQAAVGQGSGSGCIGTYYAYAKMTNSSGTYWLTPPAGTTNGIFKDASGFPAPYASATTVIRRSDLTSWCANTTNGVSFPASSSTTYTMTVYVNSQTPPPTNGQPMKLQVTWQ
jgi:hypothetical protein